jgi:transcription antitermination factor NusG
MACLKTRKSGTGKNLAPIGDLDRARVHLRVDSPVGFPNSGGVSELPWFVAHTKPRREKKLVEFCERQGFAVTLPCYNSAHKYRGKTVVFRKPLFPGYVFLRLGDGQPATIRQNEHVANLLEVFEQETFERQLQDILTALEADVGVRLAPAIGEGMRVRIKEGPLQGIEGWVEQRHGTTTVLLRLDFISQAAAVKVEAHQLQLI